MESEHIMTRPPAPPRYASSALLILAIIVEGEIFQPGEEERGEKMEAELTRLRDQHRAHGIRSAKKDIQRVIEGHRSNPTQESFDALRERDLHTAGMEEHTRQLRKAALATFRNFAYGEYRDFWVPIFERMISAGLERAEACRETERAWADDLGIEHEDGGVVRAIVSACNTVRGYTSCDFAAGGEPSAFHLPGGSPLAVLRAVGAEYAAFELAAIARAEDATRQE